jgi:hypothetical protein
VIVRREISTLAGKKVCTASVVTSLLTPSPSPSHEGRGKGTCADFQFNPLP